MSAQIAALKAAIAQLQAAPIYEIRSWSTVALAALVEVCADLDRRIAIIEGGKHGNG